MMNRSLAAICMSACCLSPVEVLAQSGEEWRYQGDRGPDRWAQLNPAFALCGSGRNQSPVDLAGTIKGQLPPAEFDYQALPRSISHTGHTIQVDFGSGSLFNVGGQRFELQQLHFHAPGENVIDGQGYAMEAHFVHTADDGSLAVVAVMFEQGKANDTLASLWQSLPRTPGASGEVPEVFDTRALLPGRLDYFRFNGSLTTPPCSEGVRWYVLKEVQSVSAQQIERFTEVIGEANNRPIQPLNARIIIR